jgi:hypothetical protein
MKKLLLIVFIMAGIYAFGRSGEITMPVTAHQVFFIANHGQWPADVKYLAKSNGVNIWITNSGIIYDYYQYNFSGELNNTHLKNGSIKGHVVAMSFGREILDRNILPHEKQNAYYNYFLGDDPSRWAVKVPLYKSVTLKNVYPDIDVELYADHGNLRYDFLLQPGADPEQINLSFDGADDILIRDDNLLIRTSVGDKIQGDIHAFQEKDQSIDCHIKIIDGIAVFEVGTYDRTKTLRIDPLVYSTYLGGSSDDIAYDVAMGDNNEMYVTGYTWSMDFPTITGAYQQNLSGSSDAFISCFSSDGQDLIFSTYLGGSYSDIAYSIAYSAGKVIVSGVAYSEDFPITEGAFQDENHLGGDVFVTSMSNTGQSLNFSTYVGGFGFDTPSDMEVGEYILVGGATVSDDFPVTADAYDNTFGGGDILNDGFVFKMSFSGGMIYSSYFGGWGDDQINGVAIDPGNPVSYYVTGQTTSDNFPVTADAYDDQLGDGSDSNEDAFISKFDNNQLVYSTYIGGTSTDAAMAIAVNSAHLIMVAGITYSDDFPVTPDAFSSQRQGVYQDAFVVALGPDGNAGTDDLRYGSYFGGSFEEEVSDVLLEGQGKFYISGYTASQNFPTTSGAVSQEHIGNKDAFVTRFNFSGNHLDYSTYLGGSFDDAGYGMAERQEEQIVLSGFTRSFNFPVTDNAYDPDYNSENFGDAFLSVIGIVPTGITENQTGTSLHINQNQPNPFRTETVITYRLDAPDDVTLEVYDCTGKEILKRSFLNRKTGEHQIELNMDGFTSGLYFYSLSSGQWTESMKMIVE